MLLLLSSLALATPAPLPEDAGRRDERLIPVDHPDYETMPVVPVPPGSCKAHPKASHYTKLPLIAHRCAAFDVDKGLAWIDTDLDGELADETAQKLTPHRDQAFTWWLDAPIELQLDDQTWTAHPKLQISGMRVLMAQKQWVALIDIDGAPVLVGVESVDGNVRSPLARTGLDYNSNGVLDPDSFEWSKRGQSVHWPSGDGLKLQVDDALSIVTQQSELAPPPLFYGQPVPALDGVDIDGVARSHSELAGQPFLIEFWASWCGPCIRDLPAIKRMASKQDLSIYSVSLEDARATRRAARKLALPWTPLALGAGPLPDPWVVTGVPFYVLVDADGTVRYIGHDLESLTAAVARLKH